MRHHAVKRMYRGCRVSARNYRIHAKLFCWRAPILNYERTVEKRTTTGRNACWIWSPTLAAGETGNRISPCGKRMTAEQQQYQPDFQLLTENYEAELPPPAGSHREPPHRGNAGRRKRRQSGARYDEVRRKLNNAGRLRRRPLNRSVTKPRRWLLASLLDGGGNLGQSTCHLQALQTGLMASRTELDTALEDAGRIGRRLSFSQSCRMLGGDNSCASHACSINCHSHRLAWKRCSRPSR